MILAAILAKNEAGKDLKLVLRNAKSWADHVLLLDDHSTDATAKIARKLGVEVVCRTDTQAAWGNEAPARAELWDLAVERAGTGWIVVQDADMVLVGDPKPLTMTWAYNTWQWVLYDLWSETEYRADAFWRGHEFPRPWMVCPSRVPTGWTPEWSPRGVHCGHLPLNWPPLAGSVGPEVAHWRHRAYICPERREAKFRQYESVLDQLSDFEKAHANSILDPTPAVHPAGGAVRGGQPASR